MKKYRRLTKSQKGYTLVEMITAMAVMAIFSGALYTLFFSGGQTYQVVHDSYKAQNEARIAMSYITVKIRQNDIVVNGVAGVEHAVQVKGDRHLRIKKPDGAGYWWIYTEDGQLKESIDGDLGLPPYPTDGDVIADIEDVTFALVLSAETGAKMIEVTVDYIDGTTVKSLMETITLRSEP